MGRNIAAVLAGFAAWSALWLASNGALLAALPDFFQEDGTTTNAGILTCVLGVSVLCSLLGGYVTAWVAKRNPKRLVWILAVIQLAIGIVVQVSYGEAIPLWYDILFIALLVPMHLAGGRLRWRGEGGSSVSGEGEAPAVARS